MPQLDVHETGLDIEDVIEPAAVHRWKLDLKIAGSDLAVTGLGISSRWTTNLQIGGFADAPRFSGRADLVQGNYDFAGRSSGSTAASSASRARARPTRFSTSMPRRRSRASTPA